jgi:ketosteroid isomerase-like protein
MTLCWVLAVVVATVLSAQTSGAEEDDSLDVWNSAWIDRDGPRLGALYTENARILTPFAPTVEGRANIETMFSGMMGRGISISSTVTEEIEAGDLRVRRTEWVMTIGPRDQPENQMDNGESLEVWRRIDGEWLLHLEAFTSYNLPPVDYGRERPSSSDETPAAADEPDSD